VSISGQSSEGLAYPVGDATQEYGGGPGFLLYPSDHVTAQYIASKLVGCSLNPVAAVLRWFPHSADQRELGPNRVNTELAHDCQEVRDYLRKLPSVSNVKVKVQGVTQVVDHGPLSQLTPGPVRVEFDTSRPQDIASIRKGIDALILAGYDNALEHLRILQGLAPRYGPVP
jgi:hypothetical protein